MARASAPPPTLPVEGGRPDPPASRSRRWITHPVVAAVLSGAAVMVALLLLFAAVSRHAPRQSVPWSRSGFSFDGSPVRLDRAAPAFALGLIDGPGVARLADYKGKTVVLNFWASWCTACRGEAPRLGSLYERYRSKGVVFLGADEGDSRSAAVAFTHRFELGYPSLSDPSETLAARYGVAGLPTTFVIDPSGRLRYEVVGRVSPGPFARALNAVLAGP